MTGTKSVAKAASEVPAVGGTGCEVFSGILWDPADFVHREPDGHNDTLARVKDHNRKYTAVCGSVKK
jgi:hypothetical protein